FFFQAEDGIRDLTVTGVQTCALPIYQLAWSLAILTRFGSDFQSSLAEQDFLREGFTVLFDHQTPAGTWQHGRPLFHYREAGNARSEKRRVGKEWSTGM